LAWCIIKHRDRLYLLVSSHSWALHLALSLILPTFLVVFLISNLA
jgi:hypothetical protein